ncbi:MAG TPA: site-specific DNA-methyltransferase [Nitrospinae bacterium]|nr:site-specific DNA-methyltransferase [Nitrospinota bacterium]
MSFWTGRGRCLRRLGPKFGSFPVANREKKRNSPPPSPVRYSPDNPHPLSTLKTELVWEGKYDEYGNRREVDVAGLAMPLQKIETVDEPRSRTEAQGGLFDAQKAHLDDFRNMLIWGDNKLVMASLMKEFKGKIDLIYIDPPFDVGADFSMAVPVGEEKESVFKDQSTLEMVAYRDMWGRGTDSYLYMLYERLVLMKELLSAQGSIYVHVGPNISHYVKNILDEIFGSSNFLNEIVWQRFTFHADAKRYGTVHDILLFYSKSSEYIYEKQYVPLSEAYTKSHFKEDDKGRLYRLSDSTAPGHGKTGKAMKFGDKVLIPPPGTMWRWGNQEVIDKLYAEGTIVLTSTGNPAVKRYHDEIKGNTVHTLWTDINPVNPQAKERCDFQTQKPEAMLERIIKASSLEDALVADFFCGSGTTGVVAERLNRRWILADLGRFAIHTSRKRLIELQRELHREGKPYRAFDVHNLGRYERQWWQRERLKGADEDHRKVVLEFYKAEPIRNSVSPLIHGRKGPVLCHVDGIDRIFTRDEAGAVATAVKEAGAKEVTCLAWEFEMDLRMECNRLEKEHDVKIRLIQIPREIMEKNRKEPPPFLEVATLEAEPVLRGRKGNKTVDIKLTSFIPSLAEVPTKELEVLQERAMKSGFDFIDFWAVDFNFRNGGPFNHHWQDYRTRKDRSLRTVSDQGYAYPKPGRYTACVKVVDIFGCDTSITVEIDYA